jgi:hypothetical protein
MVSIQEEKLIYSEIQKKLFYVIPEKWESIYLYTSIIDVPRGRPKGEMYFYYFPKSFIKKKAVNGYEIPSLFDVDEEEYMQQLYKQLAKMRQERKDAQSNAKSLDNRLNLLKEEERKTLKKIEATKKMANNKLLRLQERVENNRIKEEAKKIKEKEIEKKRERNKKMIEEIKNNTAKNKAFRQKQIEDEARLVKMQKQYNKQMFNYLKEENINENKTRYKCLKSHKNFNDEKKKIENREKRLKLKQELEKKLLEEYRLKEEAEAKKCKAEQEELEIIKKLQTTTQLHKNITEEMEKMNINSVMKGDYGFLGDNMNNNNLNQK